MDLDEKFFSPISILSNSTIFTLVGLAHVRNVWQHNCHINPFMDLHSISISLFLENKSEKLYKSAEVIFN